jgi:AcrR family transcriptional regulator
MAKKPNDAAGPRVKASVGPTVSAAITADEATLDGRRGQAARNDVTILAAARAVFLADPQAPISAVAKQAGVGISALYRRWPSKEDLLRQLCGDGLDRFIAEAEAATAAKDGWSALTEFLRRVVDADVHSLTVHLAGTFTPTPQMFEASIRANLLVEALVRRAHKSGRLRKDVGVQDFGLVLEGCSAIRVPDTDRTVQLRRRYLALLLDGLSATDAAVLPGPAPDADELGWRWRRTPPSR